MSKREELGTVVDFDFIWIGEIDAPLVELVGDVVDAHAPSCNETCRVEIVTLLTWSIDVL